MSSFKIYSVMALIAVICYITLIGLQITEWAHYGADLSVWPTGP